MIIKQLDYGTEFQFPWPNSERGPAELTIANRKDAREVLLS